MAQSDSRPDVASLITAWVVIRLTTTLVRDRTWSRFIAIAAWTIAALNILDLLEPTTDLPDGIALTLGGLRISALIIIKAVLSLAVLLWLATIAGRLLERRITTLPSTKFACLGPSRCEACTLLRRRRPNCLQGAAS